MAAAQTVQFVYENRQYSAVLTTRVQQLTRTKIVLPDGTMVRRRLFGPILNGRINVDYYDEVLEGVPLSHVARDQHAVLATAAL